MIKNTDFYCQFTSYSNKRLGQAACGITAIGMVLSAEKKISGLINKHENLDNLFCYVNSLQRNNIPAVKRQFLLNKTEIWVTLGFARELAPLDTDVIVNDEEFFPAFVLYRGYDHRASTFIFKNFGLEAILMEDIEAISIYNLLENNKEDYFLASIKTEYTDKDSTIVPSHIVVVHKAVSQNDGTQLLEYIDPAETIFEEAKKQVTVAEFASIFNNFGTYIK